MDHDKLYPYPKAMPEGYLVHLIGLARGKVAVDVKRDGHFLWHVAGYAASQVDPHAGPFGASDPVAELEACQANGSDPDMNAVLAACKLVSL